MDVVEQQTENLELHTNALQILLGEPNTNALSDGLSKASAFALFLFSPSFCLAFPLRSNAHDMRAWVTDVLLLGEHRDMTALPGSWWMLCRCLWGEEEWIGGESKSWACSCRGDPAALPGPGLLPASPAGGLPQHRHRAAPEDTGEAARHPTTLNPGMAPQPCLQES